MKLSESIADVFSSQEDGAVSVRELLDRISHKSFGVFLTILALPSALPLPAPGYSVPFGIILFILGVQMMMNKEHPWFPEWLLKREMKTKGNERLVAGMVRFLSFFEKFIAPRFSFMYTNPLLFRMLGGIVTLCAISMMIPVPLTNTGPALGIFLIGIGTLEEDGLFAGAGIFVSFCGIALTTLVLTLIGFMGMEAVDYVKEFIKSGLGMAG